MQMVNTLIRGTRMVQFTTDEGFSFYFIPASDRTPGFWVSDPVTTAQYRAVFNCEPFVGSKKYAHVYSREIWEQFCSRVSKKWDRPVSVPTKEQWFLSRYTGGSQEWDYSASEEMQTEEGITFLGLTEYFADSWLPGSIFRLVMPVIDSDLF